MTHYWPLERGHIVTSGFGARWGGTHWGTDFGRDGGSGGMPVYAVQGGTVVHVGPASGFGQWVVVDHPTEDGGGTTVYGHIVPEVGLGQRVEAGQRIARINPDQNTNGGVAPHLHLEWHRFVWTQPGPNRLDPLLMLDGALFPGEDTPAPAPAPVRGLTAETLSAAMGGSLPIDRYRQLLPAFAGAMIAAGCTTVDRAAMWCAQLGTESGGLRWMEELASGAAYEGRSDLGNNQSGDGVRFKGRGPIQVTGRHNYGELSRWAHGRGLVSSPTFFLDHPDELASDRYGFLGAVWYWTAARPQINALCDARNLEAVTRAINGGLNGLSDRSVRYQRCLDIGTALLPDPGGFLDMLRHEEQVELLEKTRELHRLLVAPEPSMVDGQPYAAATLIRTADYHAFHANVQSREILEHLKGKNQ